MNYSTTPSQEGAFDFGRTGSAGYYNFSQGIPWYHGRSQIATIPEWQRNPWMLQNDLVMNIQEGRNQFSKILYQYAEANGRVEMPDVKFRWRVNITPHKRIYLKQQSVVSTDRVSTFKLTDFTRPTQSYPTATGNPKVVGQIAQLQAGDYLLVMFSWLAKDRTGSVSYKESYSAVVPEICRVISVDYSANSITVERNWAGAQRTTSGSNPATFTVVANSTASPTSTQIRERDAFFIILPRAMKEDEIDAKVHGMSQTWAEGLMQRSLEAWGAGYFQEIINRNLGLGSKIATNKQEAITRYYDKAEIGALFGEKAEGFDPETGDWWGMTDGLLTNIPKEHYIGLVPMRIQYFRDSSMSKYAYGSFDIPVFNKILEDKGYFGSETKLIVCGQKFYTAVSTMINQMTQNIPTIVDSWGVRAISFNSSGGLNVKFILSDVMTLNGFNNKAIMVDPSAFRVVGLKGYPTDIIEIANENPLKSNGFIHGVYAYVDMNPDAHWVFTLDDNLASTTGATFANYVLGVPSV